MALLKDDSKLLVIAGPCSLETEKVCETVGEELVRLSSRFPDIQFIFKGSFDKANRTSLSSPRGPGLKKGLEMLSAMRKATGFPVLTDFHLPEQAREVGEVVDVLQVPAFLCRQTDLLVAAASTNRVVNVKKGQFLSPGEMKYVIEKLEGAGAKEIWQTERGSSFGYQNLVVDMRNFDILKQYGHPIIFDATHSVQMPGGGTGTTSGKREFVPLLARAALAAGANGLFVETHPNPELAISDGPNQVPLAKMEQLLEQVLSVWSCMRKIPPLML